MILLLVLYRQVSVIYILLITVEVAHQEHNDLLMQSLRTEPPVEEEDSIDRDIMDRINRGSVMIDPISGGNFNSNLLTL